MPYPNIPRRDSAKEDEEKKRVAALAALPAELRDKFIRGKKPEWDAALGQKAPTFDNRCLGACALIPRFHVARVDIEQDRKKAIVADSLLAAEVSFLLQVKNFRFVPELPDGRDWLTPANMRKLRADHFMSTAVEGILEGKGGGHISQAAMGKWMETALHMQASAKPGHVKTSKKVVIEAPRSKGRSRFSRPALRIVRALLLSGLSPKEFKTRLLNLDNAAEEITEGAETWGALRKAVKLVTLEGALNTDKMKGLRTEDTEFLERIGDSWENISIRDERLESYSDRAEANQMARNEAIEDLISSEINPRIRHRLTLLDHILEKDFMSEDRRPDRVVIEFAREGFLGAKAAKKKLEFQNAQRDERLEARLAIGANAKDKEILTWQLSREQGGKCLFCGKGFSGVGVEDVTNRDMGLDLAEQAHIVSKARGGPRAYMNLVLACRGCNRQQGTLYHADAFARGKFVGRDWDAFVGVVEKCSAMRPLKKKLLTTKSETEAAKMVQNRTALQETAWIAKLARTLICLKFGWPLDFKGQEKRIVIVTGAITNRVAQRYKLYRLLGPPGRIEEIEKSITQATERLRLLIDAGAEPAIRKKPRKEVIDLQKELDDKCRDDKRHHGLDAMILSFLPHWAGDPGKNVYFGLPKDRNWYEFFKRYLDSLTPQELEFKKPVLRETIYGMRPSKEGEIQAAIRRPVLEMAYDGKTMEGELIKFGTGKLRSSIVKVRSDEIRLKLTEIADELDEIGGAREKELHWQRECGELRLTSDGPLIKRVSCWSDKPSKDNYQNMAKDWSEEGDLRYRGQWRCGKGSHQGQWLYLDSKRKPRIKAVKVFESVKAVRAALATSSECSEVIAFLQSGCVVEITQEVISGKQTLPPGRYRLGGVEEKARKLDLEKPDSTAFTKIPITSLLKAGFRRVDSKR
ncbi:MAG: HNH endonuclease [Verrucomicrobia bacterium]|nr:HNH endonuclease [Verrucomicrobiota bacterium]